MLFAIHDTRNLLTAVGAFADLIEQELEVVLTDLGGTPAMARAVATIQQEFVDMHQAVSHIMQITYDAPGTRPRSLAPASFREAIERTLRLTKRSIKHLLQMDRPPDIFVRAPAADLVRVLHNLIANANDAVNRSPRERRITVHTWASTTTAFVEVWDNGLGISDEDCDRVFDLFHSSKSEGGGVGLAACKTLVERWGGTIDVESSPDAGTTFRFSIPVL
jgi:signal transduction histidine kinase